MAALKTCSACGNQIAVNAKNCPQCGQSNFRQADKFIWSLIGVTVLVAMFVGMHL